jgi:hypothetical protein
MSIQSNSPAIKPTLLLDFANVKQLDPRITFSRASTATYYGTQTAKAEENLLLQSQDFNENAWQKTEVTATANSIAAPDGTTTADTLTNTTVNTLHIAFQAATLNGQAYAFSVFAKKGTADFVFLRGSDGTSARQAWFNLATGAVGTVETNITASITDVGNGWYRCVGVWSISSSASTNYSVGISEANGVSSYAGTSKDIYVWGAQLEQRSAVTAYTPTTTQPITNYVSQLQTAASGVARFDHNPITDESLGLLIEEQRANLCLQSENFATTWTTSQASITTNTVIAPDGTLTGDKLVEDTATSIHVVQQVISFTTGTTSSFSVYVKAAERTRINIQAATSATFGISANFDLSNGTVISAILGSASIQSVGNGWYRCTATGASTQTASTNIRINLISSGTTVSYTGNGYSGVFLWGAQLEAGAFPTSYIPTVASQVTRSRDDASMTGANFSSWYNQAEGTVYSEYSARNGGRAFMFDDGSTNNRFEIRFTSNTSQLSSWSGNIQQISSLFAPTATGLPEGVMLKASAGLLLNDAATTANGVSPGVDTSCLMPLALSRAFLGSFQGTSTFLNGHIRKLSYYPLRVTNAQLQALTS